MLNKTHEQHKAGRNRGAFKLSFSQKKKRPNLNLDNYRITCNNTHFCIFNRFKTSAVLIKWYVRAVHLEQKLWEPLP